MTKTLLFITCLFEIFSFPSLSAIKSTDDSQITMKRIEQPIVKTFNVPKRWPLWNINFNYSFTINLVKSYQTLIRAGAGVRVEATFIDEIENDNDFFYKQYRYIKSTNEIDLKVNEFQERQTQKLKDLPILHVQPFDAETFLRHLKYFFAVEIDQQRNLQISVYKEKDLIEHSTFAFKARKVIFKNIKITFLKPYTNLKDNQLVINLSTNYFDRYETNFNDLINSKVDEALIKEVRNISSFKKFYEIPQFTLDDLKHFSLLNFENKVTIVKPFLKALLTKENYYLNNLIVPKIVINYQPIYEINKMFKSSILTFSKKLTDLTKIDVVELLGEYNFMFPKYLDLIKISDSQWKVVAKKSYAEIIKGEQKLFLKSTFKEKVVDPKITPDPVDETRIINEIGEDDSKDKTSNQKPSSLNWQIGLGLTAISLGLVVVIFLSAFIKKSKKSKKKS